MADAWVTRATIRVRLCDKFGIGPSHPQPLSPSPSRQRRNLSHNWLEAVTLVTPM